MAAAPLETRFEAHLRGLLPGGSPHLLIALSGGLDSVVLAHLLRFKVEQRLTLSAAHFDHRMREVSGADARWVRGLSRAWRLPLHEARSSTPLRSEAEARRARYDFLRAAAASSGADWIVTAHHADDQAETVLFRAVRGTGLAGLRGMRARTRNGVLRPMLPFWREEIEEYAARARLAWREDATNVSHGPARNRIRNRILPELERHIARGARRNLVALAAQAAEAEEGWRAQVARARRRTVTRDGEAFLVARDRFREYDPAITTRVLRQLFARLGTTTGRIGTHSALQFISDAPSGKQMEVGGGVRILVEFDRARIERAPDAVPDESLQIEWGSLTATCVGMVRLGGRAFRIVARIGAPMGTGESGTPRWSTALPLEGLDFPLEVRSRRPGDRVRTHAGGRALKRLMIDRRVPLAERHQRPVVVDAGGRVVWAAGLSGDPPLPKGDEPILHLAVYDA